MNHEDGEKQGAGEPSGGRRERQTSYVALGGVWLFYLVLMRMAGLGSLFSNTLPLPLSSYEGFSGLKTWGWRRQPLPRVGTPKVKGRLVKPRI